MCSHSTKVFVNNNMDPRHCVPSSSKTYKWDAWVKGELVVYMDSLIIYIVNSKEVLQ